MTNARKTFESLPDEIRYSLVGTCHKDHMSFDRGPELAAVRACDGDQSTGGLCVTCCRKCACPNSETLD